jgi:NADH dehydrogenase/NADH:ubiquinone oxidoreductase subunit G
LTGLKDASGLVDPINLSMLKGPANENFLRIMVLKPEGNSAGAWHLGVSSSGESSRTSKRKGGLLLLSGEEGQALEFLSHNNGVDFLAIVSPYFSETLAEKGDVMIPIPFWMEEDGTYTSLDGLKIAYKKKVVNSPKEIQDTWQTLMSLADKIGFHPDLKTWDDLCKKAEESIKRDGKVNRV